MIDALKNETGRCNKIVILKKSKFKYVDYVRHSHHGNVANYHESWRAFVRKKITGNSHVSFHDTEGQAAKAVDKYLASQGFMPVNCLKKV